MFLLGLSARTPHAFKPKGIVRSTYGKCRQIMETLSRCGMPSFFKKQVSLCTENTRSFETPSAIGQYLRCHDIPACQHKHPGVITLSLAKYSIIYFFK